MAARPRWPPSWNSNFNRHHRSFEADVEFLAAEGADLIVLSETARPAAGAGDGVAWVGAKGPGLGVMARNGYSIAAHDNTPDAPPLFGAFHVGGPVSFNLLAAWPVQIQSGPSYSKSLHAALAVFNDFLREERVIMVGDMNSSTRVSAQAQSHPSFVDKAAALGLTSIYHHQTGEAHGAEKLGTYRHNDAARSPFHLDYCFLSKSLLGSASIRVLNGADWEARSDHFPIVVDFPDVSGSTRSC